MMAAFIFSMRWEETIRGRAGEHRPGINMGNKKGLLGWKKEGQA
jgi:hypothetical protein